MKVEENTYIKEKFNRFAKDLYLSLSAEGKSIYLNAWGMSMYPFIKSGDRIKIEPIYEREMKIGDIVALDTKDKDRAWFFVHRVVKIEEDNGNSIYFTKGDFHTKTLDEPVTLQSIAGKITEIQRKNIKFNLKHPLWRFFNFIIARLSLRHPNLLRSLSRLMNLAIEHKLILFKVRNRLRKGNPILYNTEELLLICSRKDLDEELKKKAQDLIREGVDWERFSESAMRGGVTVLVYEALKILEPYVRIPQGVLDRLKSAYLFIVSKVTSQHKELKELLNLFTKNDIPVIPLKGTLLSKQLYGDVAARGLSVDFDFLIEEKNRARTISLLQELGYSFKADDEIKQWQWCYTFFKSRATMLELHWDITMMGRTEERIEGLWKGTRLAKEDNISYCEFEGEELLLYLSAHLVNSSCFKQLRYVCDINELLQKYKNILNWNSIIEKAKRWKLSNSLYTALKFSKSLFNSDIPLEILRKFKPNFLKLMLIKGLANRNVILRDCYRRRLMHSFLSYIFFELIEAKSFLEYVSTIKRVLFPPKEVLLITKSNDLKPLFVKYIIRLFKGVFKIGGIKYS